MKDQTGMQFYLITWKIYTISKHSKLISNGFSDKTNILNILVNICTKHLVQLTTLLHIIMIIIGYTLIFRERF